MEKVRETGDLLWKYHLSLREIKELVRVKNLGKTKIYVRKRGRYFIVDYWRRDLEGLIEYLKELPNRRVK